MTAKVPNLLHQYGTFTVDQDTFYKLFIGQGLRYSIDSRKVQYGDIFFALKGANFNGNQFALQALKDGASYAVIDEEIGSDTKLIKVDDVLRQFQQIANFNRRAYSIPVIAVAGSNGKTTTKNLIHGVLSKKFRTHVTAGNYNNHIGVPITLLDMPVDTEIAVIEIGTNHPGEIAALCKIVEPNFGIVTNIGKEHLEGFGTIEAIAKEEGELLSYLKRFDGHAFVNGDDEWIIRMAEGLENMTVYYSRELAVSSLMPSISFSYKNVEFRSKLMGDYNLENIMAAIRIGEAFEVPLYLIAEAIEEYVPSNNRSQWMEVGTNLVWMDAYNANPSSMAKAIENFHSMKHDKKVLLLGDMREMGKSSDIEHKNVIDLAVSLDFSEILVLGEAFFKAAAEHRNVRSFANMDELKTYIASMNYINHAFLVKGSRAMQMELSIEALPIS